MSNARGKHVSPGVYTKEIDLTYAAQSLGITSLGIVGETKKGPAFEPITIEDWAEFKDYFGGVDASKFKDSGYPKYELPYIAKSYLSQSKRLQVCRVLGLSGYNAGPAWVITAHNSAKEEDGQGFVVAIIRSRGHYEKISKAPTYSECDQELYTYDELVYDADDVKIIPYSNANMMINCGNVTGEAAEQSFNINSSNYGLFTLVAVKNGQEIGRYPVSLNTGVKDYIINVLGTTPDDGDAHIYVDELYDLALVDAILRGEVDRINVTGNTFDEIENMPSLTKYDPTPIIPIGEPVLDIVSMNEEMLKRSNVGQRYLAGKFATNDVTLQYHGWDNELNKFADDGKGGLFVRDMEVGCIYTVRAYVDPTGKRHYFYAGGGKSMVVDIKGSQASTEQLPVDGSVKLLDAYTVLTNGENVLYAYVGTGGDTKDGKWNKLGKMSEITQKGEEAKTGSTLVLVPEKEQVTKGSKNGKNTTGQVLVLTYDKYFALNIKGDDVIPVSCDLNDYKEQFRCASTPWFVSELKGDGKKLDIKKLFRFHTISDGNDSNTLIKVSIANVRPDEGTFDVLIRDYYDSDGNVNILERYNSCNMVPGTPGYIGLKIGTTNGDYAVRSKYVTVEVIENDTTATCVPCGFLGYPIRSYDGQQTNGQVIDKIRAPKMIYNLFYDDNIKERRQYFGLSDITGVDVDILKYKGVAAYGDITNGGYTPGFHLDSTLNVEGFDLNITVDGEEGYTWDTVSPNSVTSEGKAPVIGTEANMVGTIYENVVVRKFTAYPYGGFDGWDVYRGQRSNTDDFKASRYKGDVSSRTGQGTNFSKIRDVHTLNLTGNCITSDYYAFLAGAMQFDNPEKVDINVFATPGIDYVNNTMLVGDILDMIEEDRADSIYIVTTPDKPMGASDSTDEMYSPLDAVANLEDANLDTSYAATYYPWVKYYDRENNIYINLPVTKDVVRNFAMTDNKSFPWYAPAGIERGNVECYKAHFFTKISDEDTLYDGRINPVKSFSQDGIKIWGNKTLYTADTPLNRVNVRRLMLYMRKLIVVASLKLIFEPNDTTLKNQFESLINPILANIKENRGITDYKLVTSQTPEQMDRHELSCKLWVKPTPSLEYIDLTFMITPQSVDFEE